MGDDKPGWDSLSEIKIEYFIQVLQNFPSSTSLLTRINRIEIAGSRALYNKLDFCIGGRYDRFAY